MLSPNRYAPGDEDLGRRLHQAAVAFRVAAERLSSLASAPSASWVLTDVVSATDALAAAAQAGTLMIGPLVTAEVAVRSREIVG